VIEKQANDVPELLRMLLADDPGRPRVTWYGEHGERVELSAKTLLNWVSKTSNLLVQELDAEIGFKLGLALPAHWRSVVWLLAGWNVGAHVVVFPEPTPGAPVDTEALAEVALGPHELDALVTDRPSSPPPGTQESQLVVVALPALATRFEAEDVPDGVIDAATEVRLQPDYFPGVARPPAASDPALTVGAVTLSYGELLPQAYAVVSHQPAGGPVRLLTGAGPQHALADYLAPLTTGGSLVLHHDLTGLTAEQRDHLVAQEGVTAQTAS
jgi:uncharacterized protein (TIGR03089 family)